MGNKAGEIGMCEYHLCECRRTCRSFFKHIWIEMKRRSKKIDRHRIVFLGDGAEWIWKRIGDLANTG